ncbi:hypothetical protein BKA61DRAFT_574127 [Leptodontidium sp. MPI-SDFR-AT-0119]|nr:hypothetical protein BKA61DRAFT_574127 [Leptodontidium sp. MPI-SDFR-AT-0119]
MGTLGQVLHKDIQHGQMRKRHIPIIFVTGLLSIDKTTHSRSLSEAFDDLYLSLSDVLAQMSTDAADPRAEFAALYLKKGLDTSPVGYMTDLFKEKIHEGAQQRKRYIVVDGFPRNAKQLRSFVEKINCHSSEEDLNLALKAAVEAYLGQGGKN